MLVNEKDTLFIKRFNDFNLILDTMKAYGNIIVLKSKSGKYVFMDRDFNILHIGDSCYKDCVLLHDSAYQVDYDYQIFKPFANYSLKEVLELATSLNVYRLDYTEQEKDYIYKLLCFFGFLRSEVNRYFKDMYPMIVMNIGIVDVFSYIGALINKITKTVNESISQGRMPVASEILQSIGRSDVDCSVLSNINNIISLIAIYGNVDTKEMDIKLLKAKRIEDGKVRS